MRVNGVLTLVGVFCLAFAFCTPDESEEGLAEQPMALGRAGGGKRAQTPEVVLQLKYDGGELDRIYLAQFRQAARKSVPSVPARSDLCVDLCHAGPCPSFVLSFVLSPFSLFSLGCVFDLN